MTTTKDKDHIHWYRVLPLPIPDPHGGKPFRYVCISCGTRLKIASGVLIGSRHPGRMNDGCTLLEMLVVLGIVLLVASIGVPILFEALKAVRGFMALVNNAVTIH